MWVIEPMRISFADLLAMCRKVRIPVAWPQWSEEQDEGSELQGRDSRKLVE
jgi:hypothetical protein